MKPQKISGQNIRPHFKIDDLVQSAPDSSDVTHMEDLWIAKIVEVKKGLPYHGDDGFVYETLGFWRSSPRGTAPTLRQLWAEHLTFFTPLS